MSSYHDVVLIDVREASSIAGRTPETVRRWVWSGRLSASRDGRRMLVSRDDVLRLAGRYDPNAVSMDLRAWALLPRPTAVAGEATASDLVLLDRAVRDVDPAGSGAG